MERLRELQGVAVLVGVRGEETDDEGTSLALIASANEFGTRDGHVPERSFLRRTVAENQRDYEEMLAGAVDDYVEGGIPLTRSLGLIGAAAVGDVQDTMVAVDDPPNAPSTIARKGADNPLIDTGRLRQSITWKIEED